MKSEFVIVFLLLLLLLVTGAKAQGLVFNDAAYKSAPMQAEVNSGEKGDDASLKNIYKVDLKPYCPTVREQGKISSCVGWSVGYAAMTIEKAIAFGWAGDQKKIDDNAFSAMFLYNQIKIGDCFFGAELNNAFGILKDKGNVFYRDFAVGNNCDSLPAPTLVDKARVNRVKDFAILFNPDDKDIVKIERVKRTLAQIKPVVIGMIVLENFLSLKSNDEVWYPNVGKTDIFGGHAMVVIGYDDGRKSFEVMNSWGKGWANQGFVWVRYDDFARYCKYAYQLVQHHDRSDSRPLQGSIQVRKPVVKYASDGEMNVEFSSIQFENKTSHFALKDQIILPLEFQVLAEGFGKDSYLYVISFDNDLRPVIHWPRDEKLNRWFAGLRESPLIGSQHSTLILPDKYNVFTLSRPGTEFLCIINSKNPIRNLAERISKLSSLNGELVERVQKVFNTKPAGNFSAFETDRINFFHSDGKTDIVSIVLEFDMGK